MIWAWVVMIFVETVGAIDAARHGAIVATILLVIVLLSSIYVFYEADIDG